MKGISAGFLFLLINISVSAQNVFFPNALFKALLVGDSLINTNADAEIQVSEAAAFSGRISTAGLGINDITGINAFTALTELDIPHTVSYNLTLTTNTALTYLNCSESNIANLNISALTW